MDKEFRIQIEFWKRVDQIENICDCWNWKGSKDKDGYGVFCFNYKKYRSTRFIYSLYNNINLITTDFICHTCDNPSCVNPTHLFLGNVQINTNDMVKKNRQAKGERCGNCQISNEQLEKLFSEIKNFKYISYNQAAKKYNISVTHLSRIFDKKNRTEDTVVICDKLDVSIEYLKNIIKNKKI